MTGNTTVTTRSTAEDEDDTIVSKLHKNGAISIPKSIRGSEDGYTVEKRDDGTIVLTPIKTEYQTVQSND